MQFEIPEDVHVQIIVCSPAAAARGGMLPALLDAPPVEQSAPRSGRLLLKGGVLLVLLAASFAAGDYFASRPHAPKLTGAAAALPRPAPAGEQHPFPDRPLAREAPAPAAGAQIPPEFQKQLQQPPMVIPPSGQAATPPGPGTGSAASAGAALPGKNPFGLEN